MYICFDKILFSRNDASRCHDMISFVPWVTSLKDNVLSNVSQMLCRKQESQNGGIISFIIKSRNHEFVFIGTIFPRSSKSLVGETLGCAVGLLNGEAVVGVAVAGDALDQVMSLSLFLSEVCCAS